MKLSTYIRYWSYIILFWVLYARTIGWVIIFPIAYIFRNKLTKGFLWWHLTDKDRIWGDEYFIKKLNTRWYRFFTGGDKSFVKAFFWYGRNVLQNYKYQVLKNRPGIITNYKGWETCQRTNAKYMFRTPKTKNENGVFQDKDGKYMDFNRGIYGKQRITFDINSKQHFRNAGAVPRKLWGNLYWIFAYKFG